MCKTLSEFSPLFCSPVFQKEPVRWKAMEDQGVKYINVSGKKKNLPPFSADAFSIKRERTIYESAYFNFYLKNAQVITKQSGF